MKLYLAINNNTAIKNRYSYLPIALLSILTLSAKAQSFVLVGGSIDLGYMGNARFQNNVLDNRTSGVRAAGLTVEYRFRDLFSIEGGIGQNSNSLRLQDTEFEKTYSAHTLKYSQRSAYINYFGAVQAFIPLGWESWIYAKCAYSIPIDRAETINETFEYEILSANVQHNIVASATFNNRAPSFIPEIGFQGGLGDGIFLSAGVKFNFNQKDVISGTYELHDLNTNEMLRSDAFVANANSFSFQAKISVPIMEFKKRDKPKPIEIEPVDTPDELIVVKEDEKKEDDVKIVRNNKNEPTELNNREIIKSKTIHVRTDTITIKVWDNGKLVDGDSISLNLNGEWILKDYKLKRKQLVLRVPVERKKDNYLIMYALNLGTAPPNTAAVVVYDGRQSKILKLVSDLQTCGAINIVNR